MSTPSISVVLPFRNAEATLSEAIESILTQTCTDWELLAIDRGWGAAKAEKTLRRTLSTTVLR